MTQRRPLEINVQASVCDGGKHHTIGDLITYRSTLWVIKGVYVAPTRVGKSDVHYILGEASLSLEQLDDANDA